MTAEHERRRTFAIISHPDAGKTTLTEKLLLAGGAIRMAGAVKARGDRRRARSDWMKIEQERGISVTSSVMTFERDDIVFNLLDTPGHEDFSEDTYRTLTAVDSAIMVVDAAKGIESQTLKLFEVCRLRDIPIITLINKVDREGRDPFETMDEIQESLALELCPMVMPVGMGTDFFGCYDVQKNVFFTSSQGRGGSYDEAIQVNGVESDVLDRKVTSETTLAEARETIELAREAYEPFKHQSYLEGHLTPVVFGSALKDFGVESLIDLIARYAPSPRPNPTTERHVEPGEDKVSGFVFKVQANMDANHRDRIAFLRVCSGHFQRGMKLRQVRTKKDVVIHSPILFLAQDREVADSAKAGDVIGIPNHGTIRVGDTFTEGETIRFTGLPAFAPEVLRRVRMSDTSKIKALRAALEDLAEEGLIQVFRPTAGSQWIVGVVGVLQLDVLASRARAEYKIDLQFEPAPYQFARWIKADDQATLKAFQEKNLLNVVLDGEERPVFLAKNAWELDYTQKNNEDIVFMKTRELE